MKTRSVPNRQIAEEAAEWAVLIDGGQCNAAQRRALAEWLKTSPAHVEELLIATSLLASVTDAEQDRETSIDDLLGKHPPEVLPLFNGEHAANDTAGDDERSTGSCRAGRRWHRPFLAASLAAVTLAGSAYMLGLQHSAQDETIAATAAPPMQAEGRLYRTHVGEQRSIVLADDSVVHIDADSAIRVAMSASGRSIHLLNGEAMFEVAHDEARPFRVYAGGTVAQAVGTTFNVERSDKSVKVTVVEGRVVVNNHAADQMLTASSDERGSPPGNRTVMLAAGQLVEVDLAAAIQQVRPADLEGITSWRNRELSFDDDGLDVIAAKFNRYNRTQIMLADPALSQNFFSGVFDADDPASFIAFLELTGRFNVDRSRPGRIVLDATSD